MVATDRAFISGGKHGSVESHKTNPLMIQTPNTIRLNL